MGSDVGLNAEAAERKGDAGAQVAGPRGRSARRDGGRRVAAWWPCGPHCGEARSWPRGRLALSACQGSGTLQPPRLRMAGSLLGTAERKGRAGAPSSLSLSRRVEFSRCRRKTDSFRAASGFDKGACELMEKRGFTDFTHQLELQVRTALKTHSILWHSLVWKKRFPPHTEIGPVEFDACVFFSSTGIFA